MQSRTLLIALVVLSALAPVAATAAIDTQTADLAIQQPTFIDDEVTQRATGNSTIYTVHSNRVTIQPQNFDSNRVVGFGVSSASGALTYDDQMDVYQFDGDGEVGTFDLYWEAEETVAVSDGNETSTETVRRRYTATLRVKSNTSYEHVPAGTLQERQQAAENWQEWESTLVSIFGDGVDVQRQTQSAADFLRVKHNPLAALSGQFTALLLSLFITLGGLLVLALFGSLHLLSRYTDIRYVNRWESLRSHDQDIDEKLMDLDWEQAKRRMGTASWNQVFEDDYVSRAYRNIARTPFRAIARLLSVRRPRNLVAHRLQAMSQVGYTAVVERDDVASDGGSDEPPRIVDVDIVAEDAVGDDQETVDIGDPSNELLEALDWEHPALVDFDLTQHDIDHSRISVDQAPMDLDDLMDELRASRRDFDTIAHWGEYLQEFVEFVRRHEFTDDHGEPDDIQFVLNEWLDTDDYLAEAFEIPHFKIESQAIKAALADQDPVADAEQAVRDAKEGRNA